MGDFGRGRLRGDQGEGVCRGRHFSLNAKGVPSGMLQVAFDRRAHSIVICGVQPDGLVNVVERKGASENPTAAEESSKGLLEAPCQDKREGCTPAGRRLPTIRRPRGTSRSSSKLTPAGRKLTSSIIERLSWRGRGCVLLGDPGAMVRRPSASHQGHDTPPWPPSGSQRRATMSQGESSSVRGARC
jgi:hypothetical protein